MFFSTMPFSDLLFATAISWPRPFLEALRKNLNVVGSEHDLDNILHVSNVPSDIFFLLLALRVRIKHIKLPAHLVHLTSV